MSSTTTHVSDSEYEGREPQTTFWESNKALRYHFQHYAHLEDLKFLHNEEYYASIRDLIWLARTEISVTQKAVRELEDRFLIMERHLEGGFAKIQRDLRELKALLQDNRGLNKTYSTPHISKNHLNRRYDSSPVVQRNTYMHSTIHLPSDISHAQINRLRMLRDGLVPFPGDDLFSSPDSRY